MFGIHALNIVIGLIFIYLLFSLFVSIIIEMISRLFNARGNRLYETIETLVGEDGVKAVYNHPRVKTLIQSGSAISGASRSKDELKNKRLPDHIPEELFGEIIAKVPNKKLQGMMKELDEDYKNSKKEMVKLYETAVQKTRQAYKQNMQFWVLMIGILVTLSFNVDSIKIFKELANNPAQATQLANQAVNYIAANDSLQIYSEPELKALKDKLKNIQQAQINSLDSSLGLGWNSWKLWEDFKWHSIPGWLITILALSLGAPFWFDLLKKVVNIKNELQPKPKQ